MPNVHSTLMNSGVDSILEFSVYSSLTEFTLNIVDDGHNSVDFRVKNFTFLKISKSNALLYILLFRTCLGLVVHQRRLYSLMVFRCR